MKRLAIITTHPIQYNAPLFELLTQRGRIQVKVFYTWGDSVLHNKYDPGFGKVIEWDIPLLKGYDYQFLENKAKEKGSHHFKGIDNPGIIREIDRFGPDYLMVYGWSFKTHLKLLRHYKGKLPIIFRGDSTLLDHQQGFKKLLRNIFLRWVYSHVDIALYCGVANRDYFLKMGVNEGRLEFAPHVVDNSRFMQAGQSAEIRAVEMREKLKLSSRDFVFLFAGKLEPKKDPMLLLHSFIQADFPEDVHLVIAGNGILEKSLKETAFGRSNIHWLDFMNQSDMPALYKMANVFVLPSKGPGETWGLAVNEAMASGVPCIVSNRCGSVYDLINHHKNGCRFEAGNGTALSEEMKWMYENRSEQEQFKKAALEKIKGYSLEETAMSIENILINEKSSKTKG